MCNPYPLSNSPPNPLTYNLNSAIFNDNLRIFSKENELKAFDITGVFRRTMYNTHNNEVSIQKTAYIYLKVKTNYTVRVIKLADRKQETALSLLTHNQKINLNTN